MDHTSLVCEGNEKQRGMENPWHVKGLGHSVWPPGVPLPGPLLLAWLRVLELWGRVLGRRRAWGSIPTTGRRSVVRGGGGSHRGQAHTGKHSGTSEVMALRASHYGRPARGGLCLGSGEPKWCLCEELMSSFPPGRVGLCGRLLCVPHTS